MGDTASQYHRGEMEISEQNATFHGFIGLTKWGSLASAVVILFFSLVFCTSAGFFQALGAAVVLTIAGVFALRTRKSAAH
jgi:hypothetical protein